MPKPCTQQEAPSQPQHPCAPLPLLTLGGPLSCLGPPHLRKHLLARASHQGQVGADADLGILLRGLVQTGECRSLAWAEQRPLCGARPPPSPSTQEHEVPELLWLHFSQSRKVSTAGGLPDMLICGLVVGGSRVTAKPTLPQPQSRGSPISTGDNRKIHGYGCIPVKMYKNSSVPDTQEIFPKGLGLPCPPPAPPQATFLTL